MTYRPDLSADDEDLLEQFDGSKQVGFSDVFSNLQGTQLLSVNMPAYRARDWCVTLGAFQNGQVGTNLTANVPPDNQVATLLHTVTSGAMVPEVANYNIQGIYVRVWWGTGNARERAFVSWPFGGCTLQLHAADVRIELPAGFALDTPAGVFLPRLQGFITPGGRRDGGMLSPPTLLTKTVALTDAAQQRGGTVFYAPPRAVGYRLYTQDDVDGQAFDPQYLVQQVLWSGVVFGAIPYAVDGTNASLYRGNSNTLEVSGGFAAQRATAQPNDWRRLLPASVGVAVKVPNGLDGTTLNIGVEWVLDIG